MKEFIVSVALQNKAAVPFKTIKNFLEDKFQDRMEKFPCFVPFSYASFSILFYFIRIRKTYPLWRYFNLL
jgi:hypothetical protein